MSNVGGIFSKVNEAMPTGTRNYLPAGMHRVKLEGVKFKSGTHKNHGKEFFLIEGQIVTTSVQGNANCQPGSTFSTGFDTARYPESAVSDIKAFLMAQFSEAEMATIPRNILKSHEIQQANNPYAKQAVGVTFEEILYVCSREGDDSPYKQSDVYIDIEAVEKQNKSNPGKFTKTYFKKVGTLTALGAWAPPVAA